MQALNLHPAATGTQQPRVVRHPALSSSANRVLASVKAKAKTADSGVPKQTKKRRRKQFEDAKAAQAPPATEAARPAEVVVAPVRLKLDPLAAITGKTYQIRKCRKIST